MKKPFLFTPGPTPLPDRVREALSRGLMHHRSKEFQDIVAFVRPKLKELFGTQEEVMILTSSGSGGMEAAITSLFQANESVCVVDAGKFGARFKQMADSYQLKADVVKLPWGKACRTEDLSKVMKSTHRAVFLQYSETSTGVLHPLDEILPWLKKNFPQCLIIVDGITSIGAMPFKMDEWGIDAAVTASQKALMLPPGLSFVSLSQRAQEKMKSQKSRCFYFDLNREHLAIQSNQTAFSPAIALVVALKESLTMIFEEGLSEVFRRHDRLASSTRAAVPFLGLTLATESPGVACTAAFFKPSLSGKTILSNVKSRYGFHVAGAQDEWEGKVVRFSHLGYYTAFDIISSLIAVGSELKRSGENPRISEAVQMFMDHYEL